MMVDLPRRMGLVIQDGVIHYRKQIPDRDLAQYLPGVGEDGRPNKGKWALQKSLGESTWNKAAETRRDEAAVEFNRVVAAAQRAKDANGHAIARFATDSRLSDAVVMQAITQLAEQRTPLPDSMVNAMHEIARRHFEVGIDAAKRDIVADINKQPRVHVVVNADAVIEAWLDERNADGDPVDPETPDGRNKIANKRRKIAHLFDWTGKGDFTAITEQDFTLYRARHVREDRENGTVKTRDYLIDIKALSATAKRAGLITVDHAKDLKVPSRTDNVAPPFDDVEARVILEAARHSPPAVKWPHWLAALGTAHNKEILLAHADEFYFTPDGILVWDMNSRPMPGRASYLSTRQCVARGLTGTSLPVRARNCSTGRSTTMMGG